MRRLSAPRCYLSASLMCKPGSAIEETTSRLLCAGVPMWGHEASAHWVGQDPEPCTDDLHAEANGEHAVCKGLL